MVKNKMLHAVCRIREGCGLCLCTLLSLCRDECLEPKGLGSSTSEWEEAQAAARLARLPARPGHSGPLVHTTKG